MRKIKAFYKKLLAAADIALLFAIAVILLCGMVFAAPNTPEAEQQPVVAAKPPARVTEVLKTSKTSEPVIEIQEHMIGCAEISNPPGSGGHNATLAARLTSGAIVQPGDVYSYNMAVGTRTTSRGFMEGPSVVKNVYGEMDYVPSVGGGICRTSTAIHHAVLNSGLEVVERHNHSLPVSYSQTGRDAAVAYGYLDYKFRNNTDDPIKVVAGVGDGKIVVKIFAVRYMEM